jgi:hypothetical protein
MPASSIASRTERAACSSPRRASCCRSCTMMHRISIDLAPPSSCAQMMHAHCKEGRPPRCTLWWSLAIHRLEPKRYGLPWIRSSSFYLLIFHMSKAELPFFFPLSSEKIHTNQNPSMASFSGFWRLREKRDPWNAAGVSQFGAVLRAVARRIERIEAYYG